MGNEEEDDKDDDRNRHSGHCSLAKKLVGIHFNGNRGAFCIYKNASAKEGHHAQGGDKGRDLTHCHKETIYGAASYAYGQSNQNGRSRISCGFQDTGGQNACQSQNGAYGKVDSPGKNDKGHSASHDTGHCNLLKHVKQVGHA